MKAQKTTCRKTDTFKKTEESNMNKKIIAATLITAIAVTALSACGARISLNSATE